ncbi:hypothetical protein LGM89_24420 [Burkholderia sp. AU31624]|uniref:hypothetical protein n=1 Tax=unclassified Burkholderia TaxID=2613784 RepID=UPI00117EFC6F|nr:MULTISPECIES: hypothetical protein [unclassified Burkholderia]MCA8256419.1 hypothetical protein [Burkholderia sp. AU31624]
MNLLPIITSLLSFAGGSVSSTLLVRHLDRRRLKYAADGITVMEMRDTVKGLDIKHNGNEIERLTRSHVWLWNAGRKAIRPSDVITANPLKVIYPEAQLLNLALLHPSEGAIGFRTVQLDDGAWLIEFDHWEAKHGVVLEALHTSTRVVPKITGSIDGLQPIQALGRIDIGSFLSRRRRTFRRWAPSLAVITFFTGAWAAYRLNLTFDPKSLLALGLMLPGEILLIISFSIGFGNFSIPRELREFNKAMTSR